LHDKDQPSKYTVKKLTLLLLRSFAGPFLMTFMIALFVLLMQFLWKYIDDLVGKGLGFFVIAKLLVFVSITLVPLALPLALLLSSIMTFGNLSEHSELTACKSAGISLQRIMRPLTLTAFGIALMAFVFSNYILPVANLKMNALLYDVRQQKPALYITEGVFYNGIEGYTIKVGSKDDDGQTLNDVMIYDHTNNRGNSKMVMASQGKMVMSDDERYLVITLFKGVSYEDQDNGRERASHPLLRTEFDQETFRFDLSSFKLSRTNEQLFKDNFQMLNLRQLSVASDSIRKGVTGKQQDVLRQLHWLRKDSVVSGKASPLAVERYAIRRGYSNAIAALYAAKGIKGVATDAAQDIQFKRKSLARHEIEWHRKFTLSIACLILFFIGAPLGAIIRKGGLGMPVVISVIFFIVYHIISITGEKFAREGVLTPMAGMWLSTVILLPVGMFLTYKATTDSNLFGRETYQRLFRKWIPKRKTIAT
jgi:lipopolysaccharide export system permease protein